MVTYEDDCSVLISRWRHIFSSAIISFDSGIWSETDQVESRNYILPTQTKEVLESYTRCFLSCSLYLTQKKTQEGAAALEGHKHALRRPERVLGMAS